MINKYLLAMYLAIIASSAFSQTCNRIDDDAGDYVQPWQICDDDFARRKVPRFENYPARRPAEFKPVLPQQFDNDVSIDSDDEKDKKDWMTAIHDAYNAGKYFFAGHFLFVERGACGQQCHRAIIIDLHDGRIYRPSEFRVVSSSVNNLSATLCAKLELDCSGTFTFRKNSNLIIMVGSIGDTARERGIYFYKWDAHKLKLLSKVVKSLHAWRNDKK